MGCSRSSPPRAWSHTWWRWCAWTSLYSPSLSLSLVQHPCWRIPEHPCLHCCCKHCCLWLMRSLCFSQQGIRRYDRQRLNQEEEKQVHHLFISLDYSMHIHSIIHLWIETINWCNGLPTTNYQPSTYQHINRYPVIAEYAKDIHTSNTIFQWSHSHQHSTTLMDFITWIVVVIHMLGLMEWMNEFIPSICW